MDTSTASDNQISALFRYDQDGNEDHVSLSIESDTMSADDVFAVFQLLHDRGVLTAQQAKTWLHQPKASKEDHGPTTEWGGVDLDTKVSMLSKGLKVRASSSPSGDGGAAAKLALVKVAEVESKIRELKDTLRGTPAKQEEETLPPL